MSTRISSKNVCFLGALLFVPAVVVLGEILPPPAPSGFGWKLNLPVSLLRERQVQRDLRLTEPQIAELEKLAADIAGDTSSSHLATVLSIPEKLKARWIKLLTAQQRDRLHEIELQRAPLLHVLCEPEVVKNLALRADQIKDIEVVHSKDYYRKQARIAKDLDPVSLDDVARTEERLNALLSEEQKNVLKRMRGRPVESKAD